MIYFKINVNWPLWTVCELLVLLSEVPPFFFLFFAALLLSLLLGSCFVSCKLVCSVSVGLVAFRLIPFRLVPFRLVPFRLVPFRLVPFRLVPFHLVALEIWTGWWECQVNEKVGGEMVTIFCFICLSFVFMYVYLCACYTCVPAVSWRWQNDLVHVLKLYKTPTTSSSMLYALSMVPLLLCVLYYTCWVFVLIDRRVAAAISSPDVVIERFWPDGGWRDYTLVRVVCGEMLDCAFAELVSRQQQWSRTLSFMTVCTSALQFPPSTPSRLSSCEWVATNLM